MRRKSDHRGLFSGLTFSSAMILFGVMLAAGAVVGLVVSGAGSSRQERLARTEASPPIRAVHIKPEITQVKREKPGMEQSKKLLMTPAMLRQMSQLDQRLGTLEKQIRTLSRSNLDLAEKVDTSGLDTRIDALEDSLQSFTASIDSRIKENNRRLKQSEESLPAINELTPAERKLIPPPFKTDIPKDVSESRKTPEKKTVTQTQSPAEETKPTQSKAQQENVALSNEAEQKTVKKTKKQKSLLEKAAALTKKKPDISQKDEALAKQKQVDQSAISKFKNEASFADLTKGITNEDADTSGKTGWEPVVTYHNVPKTKLASVTRKPRFTTEKSSPEVTGSVSERGTAKQSKTRKKVQKRHAVHIGSASTLYRIKDSWLALKRDNGILRKLQPHIVSAGESKPGSVPWKLLAGPVASEDEAARICTRLNAKGNFCRRTSLRGHPLKF